MIQISPISAWLHQKCYRKTKNANCVSFLHKPCKKHQQSLFCTWFSIFSIVLCNSVSNIIIFAKVLIFSSISIKTNKDHIFLQSKGGTLGFRLSWYTVAGTKSTQNARLKSSGAKSPGAGLQDPQPHFPIVDIKKRMASTHPQCDLPLLQKTKEIPLHFCTCVSYSGSFCTNPLCGKN